jgi:hypothetical protein
MSGTDEKILKVLENLQTDVTALRAGQKDLQDGQMFLQTDVQKQGKRLEAVEAGQKTLESGQQALDLKVEAIHAYQKQAHTEIMDSLFQSNEITGKTQQKLEEQVEQIKKHVGLPPPK